VDYSKMKRAELIEEIEALQEKIAGLEHAQAKHKRAEEALRRERDFADSLIETAQAIVLVLDTEGRIVRFNPYMEDISGYRLEEVQGKDWFTTFLPKPDRDRVRELFLKAVSDIQTQRNVNPIVTRDGREREIEWYDKTLRDVDGNIVGLLAIGQDITERKRLEEMKKDLIRDVSHELKTPLAKMQMSVELLLKVMESPNMDRRFKATALSEIVLGNVQRLQRTVKSILDLSSLESGRAPYHKTKVQPANLIGLAILDMQPLAEAKGLELVAELPEGLPQVEGDREQLLRVLTNLVDNAVKFSNQGKIVVSAVKKAREVEIAVSDSGYGILRENLDRVFEKFCKERARIPGAGVGLAICKAIVEAHGGRIWAESVGRGQGATVRFTLPH